MAKLPPNSSHPGSSSSHGPIFNSRTGAANLGTPLMLVSFAMVAGLIFWLRANAEPTQVVVTEPEEVTSGSVVSMQAFSGDTKSFMDREIELRDIPVASALGPHSFWTTLTDANDTPYLVHLSADLAGAGTTANPGSLVDIVGTVTAMSDSILNEWEAAGAFPGPADRIQAEFAEDFLEITSFDEVVSAPPPAS